MKYQNAASIYVVCAWIVGLVAIALGLFTVFDDNLNFGVVLILSGVATLVSIIPLGLLVSVSRTMQDTQSTLLQVQEDLKSLDVQRKEKPQKRTQPLHLRETLNKWKNEGNEKE